MSIWFDPQTQWLAASTDKRGRQPVFTDAAIQACLTLEALFGMPLRQTTGMVASLLELAGPDWPVPEFRTLCRRQRTLTVHIPCRPSTVAQHFWIDSSGVKAADDGEWSARKHGPSKPRDWRKVHLGIDAETQEIRAIKVTGNRVGDAPVLPDLLDQTLPISRWAWSQRMVPATPAPATLTSRGGGRHSAPQERQALERTDRWGDRAQRGTPQSPPLWPRDLQSLDRRSLVEAKMRGFNLLGERFMSRDFDRQVAELQVRTAALNRFTAPGTPLTQTAG